MRQTIDPNQFSRRRSQFSRDFRPGICLHVAQFGFLPGQFGVRGQMLSGVEIAATCMACGGGKGKLRSHRCVGSFVLYRACGSIGWLPCAHAARRKLHVTAQGAFARFGFSGERIDVIGQESLRRSDVDFPLILPHQLFPAFVARIST